MKNNFFKEFFPEYLKHVKTEITENIVHLYFNTNRIGCKCPKCGKVSNKFKNYYNRKIQDLPVINKQLFLHLHLKKFICENDLCEQGIFVEPVEELVAKKSRKTKRLDTLLKTIALTNSAEEGARICKKQNIEVSGDTLLRLAKTWRTEIRKEDIIAVGIDNFALKKNIVMEQLL